MPPLAHSQEKHTLSKGVDVAPTWPPQVIAVKTKTEHGVHEQLVKRSLSCRMSGVITLVD